MRLSNKLILFVAALLTGACQDSSKADEGSKDKANVAQNAIALSESPKAPKPEVAPKPAVLDTVPSKSEPETNRYSEGNEYKVLDVMEETDPLLEDIQTLSQLTHAGSDLSKPTHVVHYLYFFNEAAAEKAKPSVPTGFSTKSRRSNDGRWVLIADHTIVPSVKNITADRLALEKAAKIGDGTYDGWEAAVNR